MLHKHDSQNVAHSPWLPFELVEIILHTIRIDAAEHGDTETIKACSLVSSNWRPFFQSALLEMKEVYLTFSNGESNVKDLWFWVDQSKAMMDPHTGPAKVRALRDLLDVHPSFGKAISRLVLRMVDEECFGDSESKSTLTVASMLSLLTGVKTLSFSRFTSDILGGHSNTRRSGSWIDFTPSLKEAIANLFRSPSLKNLTVASFDGPLAVIVPEGAEIDTLTLGTGLRSQEFLAAIRRDLDADATADVSPVPASTSSCIVRHLVSRSLSAVKLVRAIHVPAPHHQDQNISTSIIDSCALHSFQVMVSTRSDVDESQEVMQRAPLLKRLTVFYGTQSTEGIIYCHTDFPCGTNLIGALAPVGLFSFQEPPPLCLSHQLEVIEMVFRWGRGMGMNVPLNTITTELRAYPPNNALKHITLKAYFQSNISCLQAERQDLTDLFCKTLGARSIFPALRSVDLLPILSSYHPWDQRSDVQALSKEFEEAAILLGSMNLPFSFNFMKLQSLDNWQIMGGIDCDDAQWCEAVSEDNIVRV